MLFNYLQTYIQDENITLTIISIMVKTLNKYFKTNPQRQTQDINIKETIKICLRGHLLHTPVCAQLQQLIYVVIEQSKIPNIIEQLLSLFIFDDDVLVNCKCQHVHFILENIIYFLSSSLSYPLRTIDDFANYISKLISIENNCINELLLDDYIRVLFRLYDLYDRAINKQEIVPTIINLLNHQILIKFKPIITNLNIAKIIYAINKFQEQFSFEISFPLFSSFLNGIFIHIHKEENHRVCNCHRHIHTGGHGEGIDGPFKVIEANLTIEYVGEGHNQTVPLHTCPKNDEV
jgi:hypothetical protein